MAERLQEVTFTNHDDGSVHVDAKIDGERHSKRFVGLSAGDILTGGYLTRQTLTQDGDAITVGGGLVDAPAATDAPAPRGGAKKRR